MSLACKDVNHFKRISRRNTIERIYKVSNGRMQSYVHTLYSWCRGRGRGRSGDGHDAGDGAGVADDATPTIHTLIDFLC